MRAVRYADIVVVGGGTAGAAVAGRLAQSADRSVILIEAGPDYGAFDSRQWPADLLDARSLPATHQWGYASAASTGRPNHSLERARVIGGCSSHNGCAAIWGSRADYDGWAALGNPGWSADELLPFFHRAAETLRVKRVADSEITPWHRVCLETAASSGIPIVADLNNLDQDVGMSTSPVNIYNGVRWNTAFAYLDPVRANPRLTILAETLVNRLRLDRGRVRGLDSTGPEGAAMLIEAGQVVLCAGSYGSPCILLRSGIGPADELRKLGIETAHDLIGVGKNLHDHPAVYLKYSGTPKLISDMQAFAEGGRLLFSEQTIAKLQSKYCQSAFDLHFFPIGGPFTASAGGWEFLLSVANLTPRSRGAVRLAGTDPAAAPIIDTAYLSDSEGMDLKILLNGIEIARDFARRSPVAALIGEELPPTVGYTNPEAVRRDSLHYYHPVGTCKMGPESDSTAVVDARGKVHGVDNLYVADAALMPVIPRANTNLPALVVGERVAAWLAH